VVVLAFQQVVNAEVDVLPAANVEVAVKINNSI